MSCHGDHDGEGHGRPQNRKPLLWVLGIGAVAVVGWLLYRSGNGNLLFYGLILLCPLMHLFMHGGHGHGGHQHGGTATQKPRNTEHEH